MNNNYINPYKLFTGSIIPQWIEERPELTASAKLVYARLCRFSGKNGKAYPRQKTLAKSLGMGIATTKRAITELRKYQLIETQEQGMNSPLLYRFLDHFWMKG